MPTCVFKCEGCNRLQSFNIQDVELSAVESGDPIQKHCVTCHTMTNWVMTFPDRRSGIDRRTTPRP
jgi:hypothetical protein